MFSSFFSFNLKLDGYNLKQYLEKGFGERQTFKGENDAEAFCLFLIHQEKQLRYSRLIRRKNLFQEGIKFSSWLLH